MGTGDFQKLLQRFLIPWLVASMVSLSAHARTDKAVQERIESDLRSGRPIVAHVVVALCDNEHQGIVPVPESLGNGQSPRTNLYWGAAYGLKTYFQRHSEYSRIEAEWPADRRVLDQVVFRADVDRGGRSVALYVVAEAWDGREMAGALDRFLRSAAGRDPVEIETGDGTLHAGGDAALVAFVGHNGLMDLPAPAPIPMAGGAAARSSIVLACASHGYFLDLLRTGGSHPLLLTTGLMAPEAYSLEAALSAFAAGAPADEVEAAAAAAYHRYQKCGQRAALRLFWTED